MAEAILPAGGSAGIKPLIPTIQYLRAIAAMMVVWHHAREQLPGLKFFFPSEFGPSGVDLFFVISGFIMVATTTGPGRPFNFIARRLIRVVPLYWLLTCTMVALAWKLPQLFRTIDLAPAHVLQSLLFIPHYSPSFPGMAWPVLVPGWTLNFEMFFYAVFAATLSLAQPMRLWALAAVMSTLVIVGLSMGPFAGAMAAA